jgi:hypothetical protein
VVVKKTLRYSNAFFLQKRIPQFRISEHYYFLPQTKYAFRKGLIQIMNIAVPKEVHPGETRVALIPEHIAKLVEMGAHITVESGIGQKLNFSDEDYTKAGAALEADRSSLLHMADMVLRIRKPAMEEIHLLKEESIYVSLLDPFNERKLIEALMNRRVAAISMDGDDPAHHPGTENGCAKLTGKFSRLCGRNYRRRTPRQNISDDDDASRNHCTGQGICHRRRHCGFAGNCDCETLGGPGGCF